MKAIRERRIIHLSDLPVTVEGLTVPAQYSITISYKDDKIGSCTGKALSLDHIVIPLILKALNEA